MVGNAEGEAKMSEETERCATIAKEAEWMVGLDGYKQGWNLDRYKQGWNDACKGIYHAIRATRGGRTMSAMYCPRCGGTADVPQEIERLRPGDGSEAEYPSPCDNLAFHDTPASEPMVGEEIAKSLHPANRLPASELDAIEARVKQMQFGSDEITQLDEAWNLATQTVPGLVAEVRRLREGVREETDRCAKIAELWKFYPNNRAGINIAAAIRATKGEG